MQLRNHNQKTEAPYVAVADQAVLRIRQTCPRIGSFCPARIGLHALPKLVEGSER